MKQTLLKTVRLLLHTSRFAVFGLVLQCAVINLLMAHNGKAQNVYDVVLRLSITEKPLANAFDMIEAKTDFSFTYSARKIDVNKFVSLPDEETNLGVVLELLSRQTGYAFRQINNLLVVKRGEKQKQAVAEATGIITGKITDAQTGERLPGATVRIAGTTMGTVTDLNGEYALRATEGEVEIEISYVGFQRVTRQVVVPANGSVVLDVKMSSEAQQLEGVVVTGVLQGQQRALNQQKTADNIKSIVSADQIGRFPDPNVAEALQRVPGVNIERDQGEGRYVLVRGLAPQFTNININGEQIPSPEAGVRFVALDAVPADQLASIEVSKTLTPDMDGDAIGGSVNLITRTAQSENWSVKSSLLGGYTHLVNRTNFQGSLEIGKRFLNNKLGVMVNSSYYEMDRGSDNWERDDEEMEIRDYELIRTRLGLSSTIDYKFNPQHEIYARGIYNRFTDREWRRRDILVPNATNSPFENHEIERLTKDRLEKQLVSSINVGGKHVFSKFNLDYEVAYAEAIQDTPFDLEVGTVGEFDDIQIDFTSNPDFPTFRVNGIPNTTPSSPYLNNANYEFGEFVSGRTYALDINRTARVNVGVPYQLGENDGLFKFGGKVRLKEKSYDITENVFGWNGGDVTFPGFPAGNYTLEKFAGGPARELLGGKYLNRPNVDVEKVVNHFNNNRNDYELDVDQKLATEALEAYQATEDVYAAFAMSKVQFNRLMVLGGFRYEKTNVSYQSKEVFYDFSGDLQEILPVSGGTDYGFLLPQLHAKYQVNNQTNVRFAATRSYARPNFQDIIPAQEIDLNSRSGNIGNPALLPVGATNVDLMIEKYFGTVGILSGGVFYKNLNNFIFNRRFETDTYRGRNFGTELELTQAQNGENAALLGIEAAYQQNLTFLPGVLSGLTVYANYTFTNSNARIQSRTNDNAIEEIRLPGQARHVGNFSLGYDKGKVNVRLASNFNGKYITEVGSDASEDLWVADRLQLDATATVTLNKRIRVFAEFLNITNQPFEVFQGVEDRFIQREFYSWWSRVGLKFDL